MASRALFLAIVLLFSWTGLVQAQDGMTGNIYIFGGQKQLDDGEIFWNDDLIDISTQNEFGIKFDFKSPEWPISIALGYLVSRGNDSGSISGIDETVDARVSELRFGVRKILDETSPVHPFIGGGLAHVNVDYEVSSVFFGIPSLSESASAIGLWIDGGVFWTLAEHFNFGAELSYSLAQVDLFNENTKAGGLHYGLLIGYHW